MTKDSSHPLNFRNKVGRKVPQTADVPLRLEDLLHEAGGNSLSYCL
jgi:hypothetical protein